MKAAMILLSAVTIAALNVQANGDWPGFQGPPNAELKADDLPSEWSPAKNVAWQAPLPGVGQSSPIVWDGRVYVASISGAMKETYLITGWDLADGKQLWIREFPAASQFENNGYISKAAPTPVADANGIIAFSETGNLVALGHDGAIRWQRNLVEEFGPIASRHGLGSSLVQNEQNAFVWVERQEDPYLIAVDKLTGKDVWKAPGLGQGTWSTPAFLPVDDTEHLVLSGSGLLAGLDPATGKRLWTLEGLAGNSVPTPQPAANRRLLLGATEGRGEAAKAKSPNCNGLVEVTGDADTGFQADFVWRARKAMSSFGSPIVHQGLAYFVNAAGVLYCLDLETGEERYAQRIAESIWATPLAFGDRIYMFGKGGRTTVVRPGDSFQQLAENRLWEADDEPVAEGSSQPAAEAPQRPAGPPSGERIQYAAIADGASLLIRTGDVLYCLRNE